MPAREIQTLVRLGQHVYPLTFESDACSPVLKRMIAEDIQLSFSPASAFTTETNDPPKAYTINGQRYHSLQSLHPAGNTYNRIDAWLCVNFGDIVEIDGKRFLVAAEKVSRKYATAMEFQKKHSEPWRQLTELIATLNAIDAEDNPIASRPEDFIFVCPKAKYDTVVAAEEFRRFCADAPNARFLAPSILDYGMDRSGSTGSQEHVLRCKVFADGFESAPGEGGKMPLVYDGGKWKFLVVVM